MYLFSCLQLLTSPLSWIPKEILMSMVPYLFFDCRLRLNNELAMQTSVLFTIFHLFL